MTSNEVIVDALPYFDQGYDDAGVRETSLAMVEEECRRYRPTKNYLEHLPPINLNAFETELMANEFERIQNRLTMEPLNMKRYELPPPPPNKISEMSAWQQSIDNSMAQLEHQAVRVMNLELMLEYGCDTWKVYLDVITAMLAKAQNRLQVIKKEIQDVNWERKTKQTQAGEKLRSLEAQWVGLVSKNYEIEQACVKLEEYIANNKAMEGDVALENGHSNGSSASANEGEDNGDAEDVVHNDDNGEAMDTEEAAVAEEQQQQEDSNDGNGQEDRDDQENEEFEEADGNSTTDEEYNSSD